MGIETPGFTVWFTGLSGAGKTTLAVALRDELVRRGRAVVEVEVLDGDEVRAALSPDLGFTREARDQHVHRLGFLAQLLARHGVVVLVAAISPFREARDRVRRAHVAAPFVEVFVDCPLAEVRRRDTRGLYAANTPLLSGVSHPYEVPLAPDVHLHTDREEVGASVTALLTALTTFGLF